MRNPTPSMMFPRSQVYFMKTMTSSNLTEAAFDRDIEMGLLMCDRALAVSVISHFRALIDHGLLHFLPMA
jgi:hypothetical protein